MRARKQRAGVPLLDGTPARGTGLPAQGAPPLFPSPGTRSAPQAAALRSTKIASSAPQHHTASRVEAGERAGLSPRGFRGPARQLSPNAMRNEQTLTYPHPQKEE